MLFDCFIRPIELAELELQLLFALALTASNDDLQTFTLGFSKPDFGRKDTIDVNFSVNNIDALKER